MDLSLSNACFARVYASQRFLWFHLRVLAPVWGTIVPLVAHLEQR